MRDIQTTDIHIAFIFIEDPFGENNIAVLHKEVYLVH